MKLSVMNTADGKSKSEIEISEKTFGVEFNEPLVHQVVVAYRNNGRSGTRKQKTRTEVRGGGRKPWNQKGTGQARAGSIRSPRNSNCPALHTASSIVAATNSRSNRCGKCRQPEFRACSSGGGRT